MESRVNGIDFLGEDNSYVFHIRNMSDDLKDLIRKNLSDICFGSIAREMAGSNIYGYKSTVKSLLERYDKKPEATRKGMIGELLAHIIIISHFDDYDMVSAFFNLEERSIKKGYDVMIYNVIEKEIWITEVKSGEISRDATHDEKTLSLLRLGESDLASRLSESDVHYWYNAINHARNAVTEAKSYKKALIDILANDYGEKAGSGHAKADDKNVILVAGLFANFDGFSTLGSGRNVLDKIKKKGVFSKAMTIVIQKETYGNVVDFLKSECGE